MTTQTVDDVLRDLAKRGEISHISLTPSQDGKLWRASFAMCSKFGISFAEDADPVKAIIVACTTAKMKPRRAVKVGETVEVKPSRKSEKTVEQEAIEPTTDEYLAGIQAKTAEREADELM